MGSKGSAPLDVVQSPRDRARRSNMPEGGESGFRCPAPSTSPVVAYSRSAWRLSKSARAASCSITRRTAVASSRRRNRTMRDVLRKLDGVQRL